MNSDIKLAQVVIDARDENGWHVIAASSDRYSQGKRPSGVVAFTRPNLANSDAPHLRGPGKGICGTARFYIREDGVTVFHGGEYDLNRQLAMLDFVQRSDQS